MAKDQTSASTQAQLRALLDTIKRMTALRPRDVVLDAVASSARRLLRFEAGGFRLIEADELVMAGTWGDASLLRPRIRIGESLSGRVAATGEPLVSHDLQNDPRLDPLHREVDRRLGYHTLVAVPLRVGSRITGVLILRSRARRTVTADEIAVAQAFADHAAIALENAHLYETARRQREQAEALTEIARDVSAALDRNTVLQRVVEHARRLCRADLATLALCAREGTEAIVVAKSGHRTDVYDRAVYRPGHALGGEVLSTREPVITPDRQADPRWPPDEPARAEEIRAAAAVPILAGEGLLGILWVNRRTPDPFTPSDVATIEALARHAAVAIQNAALYEAADARATEVQVLRRIGLNLSRSLELPRVLQEIVEGARTGTGSDAAFCALLDPVSLDVETVASSGARSTAFARYRIESGQGVGGWLLRHKRPFRTEDYLADRRFTHAYDDAARTEGIVTNVGVPVLHQDDVIGFLWVFNRTPRAFTDRDEAFLAGLGDHAAVAIVNAKLHAERQRALDELRASQDRLVQTERLRALGEMAGGVAHDFNNLLAVILGRVQLMLAHTDDLALRRNLGIVEGAALDAAQTVRRIQEFTRTRRTRAFEPVDLGQVVREALELTRGYWKDHAQVRGITYAITTDLPEIPLVAGEPAELREVVATLLVNAFEAMPAGGALHVGVRADADTVVTTVRDAGSGMAREVRERIFEPFFTTKGPRGAGLGLSVAYGIVQRHGGRIDVESAAGAGTTFTVTLPVAATGALPKRPAQPGGPAARPARVLVVEDKAALREVLVDVLRTAGHFPLAAEDGLAGLALLEEARPPDVALIDLGLPGTSGWDVAANLRRAWPHVPLVLITGWGDQLDQTALDRIGVRRVIAKPFQAEDVIRVVAEAVSSRSAARG